MIGHGPSGAHISPTAGIGRLRALYESAVTDGFVACTATSAFQVAPDVTAMSGWRLRPSPSGDVLRVMAP